jgi:hypothetical protein
MFHPRQNRSLGGAIAHQRIRDDHPWPVDPALEQLAEKLLGSVRVPPTLYEDIESVAVLIHSPPQIVTCAMNAEEDLVEVPLVARLGAPATALIGMRLPELLAPLPDRLVGDDDATSQQPRFDIPGAQTEAVVEPDAMADDRGREAVVFVRVSWGGGLHRKPQDG